MNDFDVAKRNLEIERSTRNIANYIKHCMRNRKISEEYVLAAAMLGEPACHILFPRVETSSIQHALELIGDKSTYVEFAIWCVTSKVDNSYLDTCSYICLNAASRWLEAPTELNRLDAIDAARRCLSSVFDVEEAYGRSSGPAIALRAARSAAGTAGAFGIQSSVAFATNTAKEVAAIELTDGSELLREFLLKDIFD